MKTTYLKYLPIPLIATLLYTTIDITIALYSMFLYSSTGLSDDYRHALIVDRALYSSTQLLMIFVPTLIFTIAYKLTRLSLKNIAYALLISIILPIFDIGFLSYLYQHYSIKYNYSMLFFSYCYPILNSFIMLLIIAGVSYLYAKYCKLPITPLNRKPIGLLYTCLCIAFSIPIINQQQYNDSLVNFFGDMTYLYTIGLPLLSLLAYFIYYYVWTARALRGSKDLSNYPYKIIFSYILTILLIMLIGIVLSFALGLIVSLHPDDNDLFIIYIIVGLIITSILSILLFIVLLNKSKWLIYRSMHYLAYIITITTIISIILTTIPHQFLMTSQGMFLSISINIFSIFILSLLLITCYLANRMAINFCFKNKKALANLTTP